MVIVKIIAVAMLTAILTVYLKKYLPEYSILASVAGGLLIIFFIADYIFDIVDYARSFFSSAGIDSGLLKIVVKVTLLAYLIEFSAGAVRDMGEGSLADKIILAGKVVILTLSFPVISSLFSLITKLVGG